MRCPSCSYTESRVVDSRPSEDGSAIRRRRECLRCKTRFTTYEKCEQSALLITKKDGSVEPFNHDKLQHGLYIACAKRNIPPDTLENLIHDVEDDARKEYHTALTSKQLGDIVLKRLRDLDDVAYIRFASVYKDFKNLDEFTSELRKLK